MAEPLDTLEMRWRSTCTTLLRQDVGPMKEYEKWLKEDIVPLSYKSSGISGRKITFASNDYDLAEKHIGLDEMMQLPKFSALNINQVKDIESICEALKDRFYYAGNIVLGNSDYVQESTNINDSFYILHSAWVGDSKYIAYCTRARHSEDCFGTHMAGESACTIKCHGEFRNKRCFEFWQGQNSSDCYYSHRLEGCNECFFSFNLYSKNYHIGNLKLERGKYLQIKDSLISQMADELKKKKRLPSLVEIVGKAEFQKPKLAQKVSEEEADAAQVKKTIDNELITIYINW